MIYTERHQFIVLIFNFKSFKIYPLILKNIKTNGFITSSKYSTKYLELVFVSINFEMTILLTSTFQISIVFLHHKIFLLLFLSHQIEMNR